MGPTKYRGSITREQFLFNETRVVARLISEGKTKEDIFKSIKDENLFQLPTEKSIDTLTKACYNRLNVINNNNLTELIANASIEISKQASLYLFMEYNKLVWDFMIKVIGNKYKTQDFSFDIGEVNRFLFVLGQDNEEVASWSQLTINKIRNVLIKTLVDCGYLSKRTSKILKPVYLYDEVLNCIRGNSDDACLSAFNYFN